MKHASITVRSCSTTVNTAASLFCLDLSDILYSLSALKVNVGVFHWTEVMFCNFRMIKLIVISWRKRALVHSGHDNVEQWITNHTHRTVTIYVTNIAKQNCDDCFLQKIMKRTESVTD